MNLIEIAQVYVDLVNLETEIPEEESRAKEEIGILRTKYHYAPMDKIREDNIEFFDRLEATLMCKA